MCKTYGHAHHMSTCVAHDHLCAIGTRTLLSTSAATILEVCAIPATVAAGKAGSRPLPTAAQAPGGLIEKLQPQLSRQPRRRGGDGRQTDGVTGRAPFDVMAGSIPSSSARALGIVT